MKPMRLGQLLTEADLNFVVGAAAPDVVDRERLKRLVLEEEEFRDALLGDDRVFRRAVDDQEILLRITPALYFEILLRRALKELDGATHTLERVGRQSIPVFDTGEVAALLRSPEVLKYLAEMLVSFTRIRSYVMPVRVGKGIRRRVRFNDMDIDSLRRFCATVDEEHRFGFYKRIADVCLFVAGIFPDHTSGYRRPAPGGPRHAQAGRVRRGLEDYERDGQKFYGLAEEHPVARDLELSEVFGLLSQHFTSARKPLTFIATQYLHSRHRQLFGGQAHALAGW